MVMEAKPLQPPERSAGAVSWVGLLLRTDRVPARTRAVLALLCGLLAGFITYQKDQREPTPRDFDQVWFAARSILHRVNPYPHVGPGLAFDWPHPLLYPLPAGVIAIPFAPLSSEASGMLFSILGGFALAWALMEYGYGTLFGFFSMPVRAAFEVVQWSPLLAAGVVLAPIALFIVAKPTLGAAIFLARPSRWAVVGAVLFGAIAFLVEPGWVGDWLNAIARNNRGWAPTVPYRAPIGFAGGPLVLLCVLRWRRPEARLVTALACVPQTLVWYSAVPLMLVPRTLWQSEVLVSLGYAGHQWVRLSLPPHYQEQLSYALVGPAMVWTLYMPCTLMVLRRRNEGSVPAWLERRIVGWPRWLRGAAVPDRNAEVARG
jgi:hypothetical protein